MTSAKPRHPSELTDRIRAFRKCFEPHADTGIRVNPAGMKVVMRQLRELEELAVEFRNELSALRWNAQGRQDAKDMTEAAVLAAARDPASNVRLLPVLARPFTDGRTA